MRSAIEHFTVFETAAGYCGIAWSDAGVTRFHLPEKDAASAERSIRRRVPGVEPGEPSQAVEGTIALARRYFSGERIDFTAVALDLPTMDDLFRSIFAATRQLGWGETTSYGVMAKALGHGPEVARDVGQAMAKNPVPLIIPCHRVLAAGGRPGGFSAPGGVNTKLMMLEMEGVKVATPLPAQQSLF